MKKPIIIWICVLLAAAGILWALLSKEGPAPTEESAAPLPALNGGGGESLPPAGEPGSPQEDPVGSSRAPGTETTESGGLPVDWIGGEGGAPADNGTPKPSSVPQPSESGSPASEPSVPSYTQPGTDPEQTTEAAPGFPIVPIRPPDEFG